MSDIPVILSVRLESSRLPAKCMLPLGSYKTVIEFIVERAKIHGLRPIVFTSIEKPDDIIELECVRIKVEYFRGELSNKLVRWKYGLEYFGLTWAHFADMDDPFLDATQIKLSVDIFNLKSLDMLMTSELSDSGFASVGTSIRNTFLGRVLSRVLSFEHQDFDVIPWHLLVSETDAVKRFQDIKYTNRDDLRLTLDYVEDYQLLNTLAHLFGPGASRESIEVYLDKNPDLLELNRQRSRDFRRNKQAKLTKFKSDSTMEVN